MLRLAPRCARLLSSAAPPPPPAPHKTKDFWNVLSGLNSYVKKFVARSPEERKASIASLSEELNRGYFDDHADMRRSGGKHSESAFDIFPAKIASPFPALPLVGVAESTPSIDSRALFSPSARATLVRLSFRDSARINLDAFAAALPAGVATQDIMFVERGVYRLMAPIITRNLRGSLSQEAQKSTWLYLGDLGAAERDALGITNLLVGYVYLVDGEGRVRWRAHGEPTEREIDCLRRGAEALLSGSAVKKAKK